ncbi:hypothetical protein U1Q18_039611, partial [Sarracenia purpurea var. burkii]
SESGDEISYASPHRHYRREDFGFVKRIDRRLLGLKKKKLSHIRFYWHDIVTGRNLATVTVVQPPLNTSATAFGLINTIDDPLTLGPELGASEMVGRAQGLWMGVVARFGAFNGDELRFHGRKV